MQQRNIVVFQIEESHSDNYLENILFENAKIEIPGNARMFKPRVYFQKMYNNCFGVNNEENGNRPTHICLPSCWVIK